MIPIYLTDDEFFKLKENYNHVVNFLLNLSSSTIENELQARLFLNDLLVKMSMSDVMLILEAIAENLNTMEIFLNVSLTVEDKVYDLYKNFKKLGLEKEFNKVKTLAKNLNYVLKILDNKKQEFVNDVVDFELQDDYFRNNNIENINLGMIFIRLKDADRIRKQNLHNPDSFIRFFLLLLETNLVYERTMGLEDMDRKISKLTTLLYGLLKTKILLQD